MPAVIQMAGRGEPGGTGGRQRKMRVGHKMPNRARVLRSDIHAPSSVRRCRTETKYSYLISALPSIFDAENV